MCRKTSLTASLLFFIAIALARLTAQSPGTPAENVLRYQAFWVDRTTIAIPSTQTRSNAIYKLFSDPDAHLAYSPSGLAAHYSIALHTGDPLSKEQLQRFPQLGQNYSALHFSSGVTPAIEFLLLKGQLAISVQKADGTLTYATGLQTAGVLDDLFAFDGQLGVVLPSKDGAPDATWQRLGGGSGTSVQVRVWAPTAQSMSVNLYLTPDQIAPPESAPMHEHAGVWVATVDQHWLSHYYLLDEKIYAPSKRAIVEHTVTDPYSTDISLNGGKSRLIDISDNALKPQGWDEDVAPPLARPNDLSIYELHIRDFSFADSTVPSAHRGMYLAFTDSGSDGMKHLATLSAAGIHAVHLLPTFHFSGVDEDKSKWKTTGDLSQFPSDGKQQQAAIRAIKSEDAYNWGYGPIHFLAPEGSYAVNPDNRVKEYRQMVMALHHTGLRVVQDVVFNHTSAVGEDPDSVLDKVVPNYYDRLDADGKLLMATCCADTASEHSMMGKLQQDAILWNVKHYHIDGFRFDLMGFTFVDNLKRIRAALDKLTLSRDGVDGSKVYLYGEGWEFGETQHHALGIDATQSNLYGSGVGTFNDRLRDSIRGGGVTGDQLPQGFATGLFTDPARSASGSKADQRKTLLHEEDIIKVSLAGNLRDFQFTNSEGVAASGSSVLYNGRPAGYTATPQEAINYAAAHDDMDLFDVIQVKSSAADSSDFRARRQAFAMSIVALGQGIPFFVGGEDMLRSKDMDNNSYDSGDWFNKIDWSGHGNNWGIGLPMVDDDGTAWSIDRPLLSRAPLQPTPELIQRTSAVFQEFLKIRYSSPLFRMSTLDEINTRLRFLNVDTPGVIAMVLDAPDASSAYRHILVVFNGTPGTQNITADSLKGIAYTLHPVQVHSADSAVATSTFSPVAGTAVVPALTTAVFVCAQ
jgi:pullulanase